MKDVKTPDDLDADAALRIRRAVAHYFAPTDVLCPDCPGFFSMMPLPSLPASLVDHDLEAIRVHMANPNTGLVEEFEVTEISVRLGWESPPCVMYSAPKKVTP